VSPCEFTGCTEYHAFFRLLFKTQKVSFAEKAISGKKSLPICLHFRHEDLEGLFYKQDAIPVILQAWVGFCFPSWLRAPSHAY
jgi:hypothetical protein